MPELNKRLSDEHSEVFETITLDLFLFCVDLLERYRMGVLFGFFWLRSKTHVPSHGTLPM